ncbi:MAG: hypothetical protein ACSHWZ_02760 [Sulfitobacter sp.]
MSFVTSLLARCLTALVLCAALTATGFAHQRDKAPLPADMAAFIASGGTLSDLCNRGGPARGGGMKCEACRLMDSGAPLPELGWSQVSIRLRMARLRIIAQTRHRAKPLDPARHSRAPPQA